MRMAFLIALFAFMTGASSCGKNPGTIVAVKTLDSLGGAVNAAMMVLKDVDTARLSEAVARYKLYREFIRLNIRDTLLLREAGILDAFYRSGEEVSVFSQNRSALMARGNLLSSQIGKLSEDLRTGNLVIAQASPYLHTELGEAGKWFVITLNSEHKFRECLGEFLALVKDTEHLIRARNNGELPIVISDSVIH